MAKFQISAKTILRCLARLRYGSESPQSRMQLQRDLKRFRPLSNFEISDTAIDNWFRRGAGGPSRRHSIEFLYDYFISNVIIHDTAPKVRHDLHRSVDEFLRPPLHSRVAHKISGSRRGVTSESTGAVAQWSRNPEDLLQIRTLEGSYQIIRPHASGENSFILEPMAIEVNDQQGTAGIRMYSHNQRIPEYVYTGDLYASDRLGLSLLRRKHENKIPERFALRAIALHIGTHREVEGYVSHPCLSGLMLRGVAGTHGPLRISGTPFVAMRAPSPQTNFSFAEFVGMVGDLRRLHTNSSILIGVAEAPSTLFQFCERLFGKLGHEFLTGLVLNTLRPEDIEKAVLSDATDTDATAFDVWVRIVNAYASVGASEKTG